MQPDFFEAEMPRVGEPFPQPGVPGVPTMAEIMRLAMEEQNASRAGEAAYRPWSEPALPSPSEALMALIAGQPERPHEIDFPLPQGYGMAAAGPQTMSAMGADAQGAEAYREAMAAIAMGEEDARRFNPEIAQQQDREAFFRDNIGMAPAGYDPNWQAGPEADMRGMGLEGVRDERRQSLMRRGGGTSDVPPTPMGDLLLDLESAGYAGGMDSAQLAALPPEMQEMVAEHLQQRWADLTSQWPQPEEDYERLMEGLGKQTTMETTPSNREDYVAAAKAAHQAAVAGEAGVWPGAQLGSFGGEYPEKTKAEYEAAIKTRRAGRREKRGEAELMRRAKKMQGGVSPVHVAQQRLAEGDTSLITFAQAGYPPESLGVMLEADPEYQAMQVLQNVNIPRAQLDLKPWTGKDLGFGGEVSGPSLTEIEEKVGKEPTLDDLVKTVRNSYDLDDPAQLKQAAALFREHDFGPEELTQWRTGLTSPFRHPFDYLKRDAGDWKWTMPFAPTAFAAAVGEDENQKAIRLAQEETASKLIAAMKGGLPKEVTTPGPKVTPKKKPAASGSVGGWGAGR